MKRKLLKLTLLSAALTSYIIPNVSPAWCPSGEAPIDLLKALIGDQRVFSINTNNPSSTPIIPFSSQYMAKLTGLMADLVGDQSEGNLSITNWNANVHGYSLSNHLENKVGASLSGAALITVERGTEFDNPNDTNRFNWSSGTNATGKITGDVRRKPTQTEASNKTICPAGALEAQCLALRNNQLKTTDGLHAGYFAADNTGNIQALIDNIKADFESLNETDNWTDDTYTTKTLPDGTSAETPAIVSTPRWSKTFAYDQKESTVAGMILLRGVPLIIARYVTYNSPFNYAQDTKTTGGGEVDTIGLPVTSAGDGHYIEHLDAANYTSKQDVFDRMIGNLTKLAADPVNNKAEQPIDYPDYLGRLAAIATQFSPATTAAGQTVEFARDMSMRIAQSGETESPAPFPISEANSDWLAKWTPQNSQTLGYEGYDPTLIDCDFTRTGDGHGYEEKCKDGAKSPRHGYDNAVYDVLSLHSLGAELSSTPLAASNNKGYSAMTGDEDVFDQLIDLLKGKQGETEFTKTLADNWVKQTSIDPLAGNPDSYFARTASSNFNLAANGIYSGDVSGLGLFSVTPSYSYSKTGDMVNQQLALPLQYTYSIDNKDAIIFLAPINYNKLETTHTYDISVGMGYSRDLHRSNRVDWAVTPSILFGAVASPEMLSGTAAINTGAASRLDVFDKELTFSLINDLSYLKSLKIKIGDIETPYDIYNVIAKNGLELTDKLSTKYAVGGFYTRSDVVAGVPWFSPSSNEIGAKWIKFNNAGKVVYHAIDVSLSYTFDKNQYKGVDLQAGFTF